VKIRVLSDLHLEFAHWKYEPLDEDVVVLAGDICDLKADGLGRRDSLLESIKVPVVYVLGNHEYYGHFKSREDSRKIHQDRLSKFPHVHLLDPGSVTIGKVTFVGCTLWTDFQMCSDPPRLKAGVARAVTDFYFMLAGPEELERTGPRMLNQITADDMLCWHLKEAAYLEKTIKSSSNDVVMVTHFMPHPGCVAPKYEGNILNGYFGVNMAHLMYPPVKLAICGHTHDACDFQLTHTRVVCNPRGYPREKSNYDSDKIVCI
jgi:predicted phosphodiesterase